MSRSPEDEGSIAIGSRTAMAALIGQLTQVGLHHRAVLVRAAMAGTICLTEITRDGTPRFREIARTGRPALVVVGDDDYASTAGPAGWAAIRPLRYWARAAMIHAAGASDASYERAVKLAVCHRRFVLIETSAAYARAWTDVLNASPRPIPIELLLPTNGLHPVAPAALAS